MNMRTIIGKGGLVVLLSVLASCTEWPEQGGGGAAETAPPLSNLQRPADDVTWSDTLYLRLAAIENDIEYLHAAGTMRRAPAALTLVQTLAIRVRRELAAGLEVDAAIDLLRLEEQTGALFAAASKPPASPNKI